MIEKTGTESAPWVLVEANNKEWARVKVLKEVGRRVPGSRPSSSPWSANSRSSVLKCEAWDFSLFCCSQSFVRYQETS